MTLLGIRVKSQDKVIYGQAWPSDPVLAPDIFLLLGTPELELDRGDILKALVQSRFPEATSKVTERDARQRLSGFGVLRRVSTREDRDRTRQTPTNSLFAARTASLCRHSSGGERKCTQRMGTFSSFASAVHAALVSGSAFVLSAGWVGLARISRLVPNNLRVDWRV